MLLFVPVPERSTARKTCPSNPSGLINSLIPTSPPILTAVLRSKLGMAAGFFALVERMHQNWFVSGLTPPRKRLPVVSTSSVPQTGVLGMKTGSSQFAPPSTERENCLPWKLFPAVLHHWYWNPCPVLLVLSIVNHCLSPPI